jgi:hypothetical protein
MAYGLVKNCMMSWQTEEHSFTFDTCGTRLHSLDSLGDLIGSLQDLYNYIYKEYSYDVDEDMPRLIKVRGGHSYTIIDGKPYNREENSQ